MSSETLPGWFFPLLTAIAVGAIIFGLALVATGVWVGVIGQVAGVLTLGETQLLRAKYGVQPLHEA